MVVFFYGAAGDEGLGAAFYGAGVDADVFDPVEIQGDAAIGLQGVAAQMRESCIRYGERLPAASRLGMPPGFLVTWASWNSLWF